MFKSNAAFVFKVTTWNRKTKLTLMKTTGMLIKVASHCGAQGKILVTRPSKNTKRATGTRSGMRKKRKTSLRVDRKQEPGVLIRIGTRYQMERDGEVVTLITLRIMRMSLLQTDRSHPTPSPGLHLQRLRGGSGQRRLPTAPFLRQVCNEGCVNRQINTIYLNPFLLNSLYCPDDGSVRQILTWSLRLD